MDVLETWSGPKVNGKYEYSALMCEMNIILTSQVKMFMEKSAYCEITC